MLYFISNFQSKTIFALSKSIFPPLIEYSLRVCWYIIIWSYVIY